jgi:hypothetical protein
MSRVVESYLEAIGRAFPNLGPEGREIVLEALITGLATDKTVLAVRRAYRDMQEETTAPLVIVGQGTSRREILAEDL